MRIALPIASNKLCQHFGHCESFAMIDVDKEGKTITNSELISAPPHQPGLLPGWCEEKGAELIIAGGMGQRARMMFNQHNIEVIVGAPSESPEALVTKFLTGVLKTGINTCDH